MSSNTILRAAAVVGLFVIVGPAPSQPRPSGTTRSDLQRHDLSASGREVLQARVDFAPGSSFPRHKHPGEEIIYVIEGTLEYELPGKGWIMLKKGDVLFVPDGGVHAARNRSSVPAAELATYVLVKGKPLTQFVE
ncbi:cupin domain-containing protein [Sphingosinicella rhizophila]|uniref:Cupin domain-containing protein n=1 Tax=Sphingosinicella rhizophila TaxID=3050082 RepID=A0ABU3QA33_9SPHN|nr:cupin domain-containing protein [Sphingosinicella sp. GR2756]MDT9600254.1 cupin domain-containing protein [Sphingosinicella sp. GR2756]